MDKQSIAFETSTPKPRTNSKSYQYQQRPNASLTSNTDNDSIGILSIDSIDLNEPFSISENLNKQRSLASSVLERASNITSLPSRYLRPSEKTTNNDTSYHLRNESTLNESDILNSPSSTPRTSLGASLYQLTNQIKANNDLTFDDILKDFQKTSNDSFSYAEKKLDQDEAEFRKDDLISVNKEFSIRENSMPFTSLGEFFNAKSDNVSMLAKSPDKNGRVNFPLVDLYNEATPDASLSITSIGKMLSEETPRKLLELFESKSNINNKENINHLNINTESSSSSRSSSALSNLPGGKIPIESTKSELIWGCVKPGKTVYQEFVVRNRSDSRLKLQLSISNSAFKILKNRTDLDAVNSMKLILHARESKMFTISFSPVKIGPVIDEIQFTSLDLEQTKKQLIRLFAYGGYENIELGQLAKDSTGKFWLTLGQLDCVNRDDKEISQQFTMKNTGTLSSFGFITIQPNQFFVLNKVKITPDRLIILPGEEKTITVTYTPTQDDYNYILNVTKNVLEIGCLVILTGAEITRARIKRLCRKAAEQRLEVNQICQNIAVTINGETKISDINQFKESVGAMKEICQHLKRSQIVLTLEQDLDRTLVQQYLDNTSLFQTISQEKTVVNLDNTINGDSCKIEPRTIILNPPLKTEDILFFTSTNRTHLQYEVVSRPAGLEFSPKEGLISKDETVLITIKCRRKEKKDYKVIVHVDNEALEVDVKVVLL